MREHDDYYMYDSAMLDHEERVWSEKNKEKNLEFLQSYYLLKYDMLLPPTELFREASSVALKSPTSGFVLAYSVCEVVIRACILTPLIYGSIHNVKLANLITDNAVKSIRRDMKKFSEPLLSETIGINLHKYTIKSDKNIHLDIYQEMSFLGEKRNIALHRAEIMNPDICKKCINLADTLLNSVIADILEKIDLTLIDGKIIYKSYIDFDETSRIEHWNNMKTMR
jgi:hypothetical protein